MMVSYDLDKHLYQTIGNIYGISKAYSYLPIFGDLSVGNTYGKYPSLYGKSLLRQSHKLKN